MRSNFFFFFFFLFKEKKKIIFLNFFVQKFFKYPIFDFFIFNSFFKKFYITKFFNFKNSFLFSPVTDLSNNFNFSFLLLLLEFYFFKKKLKNLILFFISLEFNFFKKIINQKKFFYFNKKNISFFLEDFKVSNFFLNLPSQFKKEKNFQKSSKSPKKTFLKPFKSYLLNVKLPIALKNDHYFNNSFRRFLNEYEKIRYLEAKKKLQLKLKKLAAKNLAKQQSPKQQPSKQVNKSINSSQTVSVTNSAKKTQNTKTNIIKNQDNVSNKVRKFSSSKKRSISQSEFFVISFFSKLVKQNTKHGLKKKSLKIFKDCLNTARQELEMTITFKEILSKIFFSLNPFFVLRKYTLGRKVILIPFPVTRANIVNVNSRLFLRALKKRPELQFRRKLIEEIKDFYTGKMPMSLKLRNERILTAIENKDNIRYLRFFK